MIERSRRTRKRQRTVDAHVHSAIRKIGAVNRTNAVAIAIRDRIIDV
ncbi:MAG: hypothetical protein ABSA90_09475 [Xanthobacteraceae bacterium]